MKKIILNEEQVKRIIEQVISEQKVSEINGGTDSNRITHALLSTSFGLPDGATHENFYYGADVSQVIAISANGDKTKFLSVFNPLNAYNKDPKGYMDYIKVNDEDLTGIASKTFNFNKGRVYASHNGLLALARSMDHMRGVPSLLTISFGSNTSGTGAQNERLGNGIQYDSKQATDRASAIKGLTYGFCALASNLESRKNGVFPITYLQTATNEKIMAWIKTGINNIGSGVGGFMDATKKDELILALKPKGFITEVNFDVTPFTQKLMGLQNLPDYNKDKQSQIDIIGKSFLGNLADTLKTIYMKNHEIYVTTFLPKNAPTIIPLIKNDNFNGYSGLGDTYNSIFNGRLAPATQTPTIQTSTSQQYQSGH
jgi:hypothetical protein